jgi:outer membrane protein assembly factor BamB
VRVDGVDLVVTSHGRIYRLADGAIVAEGLPEAVATPAAHGDKLFLCNGLVHGTGGKLRAFGYTMRWDTPDKLQVKQDWVAKVGGHAGLWTGPVYHEGLLYFGYVRNIFVLDAATGKEVVNHVPNDFGYASSHAVNPAVAGDYFFTGDALGRILVVETGREGKPEALNFLTSDLHRDDLLQSVDYMKKQWWSKDWYPGANYLANTPFFKGERVYIRTHEHLFCIGK